MNEKDKSGESLPGESFFNLDRHPNLLSAIISLAAVLYVLVWYVRLATWQSSESAHNWFHEWSWVIPLGNMAVFALVIGWLCSLIGRFRVALLITLIFFGSLSLAHWLKMGLLGVALYPWDILLVREAVLTVDPGILTGYWINLILLVPVISIIIFLWKYLPKKRLGLGVRIPLFLMTTGMLVSLGSPAFSFLTPWYHQILKKPWRQNYSFERAGLILSLAAQAQNFYIKPPAGYSKERIEAVLDSLREDGRNAAGGPEERIQPVNLIIIQSESFWDVRNLAKGNGPAVVGFTNPSDPFPVISRLEEEFGSIEVVAPVFSGGSCNSEMEIFTSSSMVFFPPGTIPYETYIRQDTPSLITLLKNAGYETTATQATKKSYYNDREVYSRLGYDRFINALEWDVPLTNRGWYIDDSAAVNQIKSIAASATRPFFIYATTMENHWPYPKRRYEDLGISTQMTVSGLDDESNDILETYVCGLKRFETAFVNLINYLSEQEDMPTLVIFYGDHLPGLGKEGKSEWVYSKTGYFNDDLPPGERLLRQFSTKMYFWNNFGYRFKGRLPKGPVSMNFAAPILADIIGIDGGPYYRFIRKFRQKYPVFTKRGCFDAEYNFLPVTEVLEDPLTEEYCLLQWDRIFAECVSK